MVVVVYTYVCMYIQYHKIALPVTIKFYLFYLLNTILRIFIQELLLWLKQNSHHQRLSSYSSREGDLGKRISAIPVLLQSVKYFS